MLRLAAAETRFIIFCSVSVIGVMISPSASACLPQFLSFPWIESLLLSGAKQLNLPHFPLSFVAASLFQSPRSPLVQVSTKVST